MPTAKATLCLWYNHDAQGAAAFYAATFPDSAITAIHTAPADYPGGKQGDVLTVEFTVLGLPCLGLNGGVDQPHTHTFSFQVQTTTQDETDRYWDAIVNHGGEASACGWCKDKWGHNWQITPHVLSQGNTHEDPAVAQRVFQAMMQMGKIDIATIEAAIQGT